MRDANIDPALRSNCTSRADMPLASAHYSNSNATKTDICTRPHAPNHFQAAHTHATNTTIRTIIAPNQHKNNPLISFAQTGPGVSTLAEQITYLNFTTAITASSDPLLTALFSSNPDTIATVPLSAPTWQALTLHAHAVLDDHCTRALRVEQELHDACVALGGSYDASRAIYDVNRVREKWRGFLAKGVEGLGTRACVGAVIEMVDAAGGMRVDRTGFGGRGVARARRAGEQLGKVEAIVGELVERRGSV